MFRHQRKAKPRGRIRSAVPFDARVDGEAFLGRYRSAYASLAEARPEALALFEELSRREPDDPCVRLHLDRLRRGDKGVALVMDSK